MTKGFLHTEPYGLLEMTTPNYPVLNRMIIPFIQRQMGEAYKVFLKNMKM